jgi:uncharacterized repeat protein (TIGR02543 family)
MKKLSFGGLVAFCTVALVLSLFWPSVAMAAQSGDFTYDVKAYGVVITGYTGNGTTVVIPSKINGRPVVSIGDNAFSLCFTIKNLTIPNSIKSIGNSAFWDCLGLSSLTIPDSVISIGSCAFYSCNGLKTVTIPDSVVNIGSYAFESCSSLKSIELPRSAIVIGDQAFSNCYKLTSINVNADNPLFSSQSGVLYNKGKTELLCCPAGKKGAFIIPNSVRTIVNKAFCSCKALSTITIPAKVKKIESEAFSGCTGLTSITIPSSVTGIGVDAFVDCTKLTSINVKAANATFSSVSGVLYNKDRSTLLCYPTGKKGAFNIPVSVNHISASAFSGCSGLTAVSIPSNVTIIDDGAFADCSSLTSIKLPNSIKKISTGEFESCTALASIIIPDSVTSIGNFAFFNCPKLKNISIPCNVISIGFNAFFNCAKLTSITIPSSVTAIDEGAFCECSNLSKAIFQGNEPNSMTIGDFDGTASNFKVYYHISHSSSWAGYTDYPAQAYCIVKMNLQNGSTPVKVQTDVTNSHIKTPAGPARTGYSLVGWYKDAACTQPWNFSTEVITGDIAVYAKWKALASAAPSVEKAVSNSYSNVKS